MQVAFEEADRLEHVEHRALSHPLRQRRKLAGLPATDVHKSRFGSFKREKRQRRQPDEWRGKKGGIERVHIRNISKLAIVRLLLTTMIGWSIGLELGIGLVIELSSFSVPHVNTITV